MMVTHPGLGNQKRDLHIGGLGSNGTRAPAVVVDPMIEAAGSLLQRSQSAARDAGEFVRSNPWAALAVVAALGAAAGYLLSQRSQS